MNLNYSLHAEFYHLLKCRRESVLSDAIQLRDRPAGKQAEKEEVVAKSKKALFIETGLKLSLFIKKLRTLN